MDFGHLNTWWNMTFYKRTEWFCRGPRNQPLSLVLIPQQRQRLKDNVAILPIHTCLQAFVSCTLNGETIGVQRANVVASSSAQVTFCGSFSHTGVRPMVTIADNLDLPSGGLPPSICWYDFFFGDAGGRLGGHSTPSNGCNHVQTPNHSLFSLF